MSRQRLPAQPVIRVAPPTELNAYFVYEHQLDMLAQGSPAALMLNFALFFLGIAGTTFGTLVSLPLEHDEVTTPFSFSFS